MSDIVVSKYNITGMPTAVDASGLPCAYVWHVLDEDGRQVSSDFSTWQEAKNYASKLEREGR